jgi:16S rRNA (cytosine1402-N4)-methyltransferase
MTQAPHIPVLLDAVVAAMAPAVDDHPRPLIVDGTFGFGGYSCALMDTYTTQLIGIDRDPNAQARAQTITESYSGRFSFLAGRFGDMADLLPPETHRKITGIVLDIGVSSMQLDEAERGFSFSRNGPLDMRMEQSGTSAADLVNTLPEAELARLIWEYGEDRLSRRIARAICKRRDEKPFTETEDLATIIKSAYPPPRGKNAGKDIHPATRTFQALRIAVNDELGELTRALHAAVPLLAPGGVLAVVTFHSLEDRIVKRFFDKSCGRRSNPSRHEPMATIDDAPAATFTQKGRKPIGPTETEVHANPRARSAKLRAAVRTAAPAEPANMQQGGT